MVVFPNAKINLGLFVNSKRSDGFHNLESVFYPITLKDALEISLSEGNGNIDFETYGLQIPGARRDNLIVKAIENFGSKDFDYKVNLVKKIPMGGGMGGGSSNAAFTLKLLHSLGALKQGVDLFDAAMSLGSDCGFFIHNEPSLVKGRGEVIVPINLNLKGLGLKLVLPGLHISTKLAFSKITPKNRNIDENLFSLENIHDWKKYLENDFEKSVFSEFPSLVSIKKEIYDSGAIYASMSGSGSTFFGIYPNASIKNAVTNFKEIDLEL